MRFDRELLEHQRIRDMIEARAAVFFGKEDAEHSELCQLVDRFGGISMRTVGLDADRPKLLACETASNVASAALRFS